MEHFDILIVGAGLSGIAAARHLQMRCPKSRFVVLERRDALGGTWDLFRYPGIRSDSDMYTLGFTFRPWQDPKAIADGPAILNYLRETALDYGIDRAIRFSHHVKRALWSSDDARWLIEAERGSDGQPVAFTCNFLFLCSGYYNYEHGYEPDFPGAGNFEGRIVHPQKWTEDIDYKDKKVVVIGSGATAVTLVPEMAKTAAHVVMLQRSPTYVVSRPAEDQIANWLRRHVSAGIAYLVTRWKNIALNMYFFQLCRRNPGRAKAFILKELKAQLGPDFDIATHFTPHYDPWDQRLCLVPDGDLFEAIKEGRASVVTDHIETFTKTGIRLRSGRELEADLIVTATGLDLAMFGGIEVFVDGRAIDPSTLLVYKGMMYRDVPNLASAFGYTNASWTLKCELTCEYVCRLLNHMRSAGLRQCTPRSHDDAIEPEPFLDFSSGYVQRAIARLPRQGSKAPWKLYQNYALDIISLRYGGLEDGVMAFTNPEPRKAAA